MEICGETSDLSAAEDKLCDERLESSSGGSSIPRKKRNRKEKKKKMREISEFRRVYVSLSRAEETYGTYPTNSRKHAKRAL